MLAILESQLLATPQTFNENAAERDTLKDIVATCQDLVDSHCRFGRVDCALFSNDCFETDVYKTSFQVHRVVQAIGESTFELQIQASEDLRARVYGPFLRTCLFNIVKNVREHGLSNPPPTLHAEVREGFLVITVKRGKRVRSLIGSLGECNSLVHLA
jgi:hypothetical protein